MTDLDDALAIFRDLNLDDDGLVWALGTTMTERIRAFLDAHPVDPEESA